MTNHRFSTKKKMMLNYCNIQMVNEMVELMGKNRMNVELFYGVARMIKHMNALLYIQ